MQFLQKRRSTPIIPIVPLLDILAILLIFFMLTTTFKERKDYLVLDPPRVTNADQTTQMAERISLEISERGEIQLAGTQVPARGLAAALRNLKAQMPEAEIAMRADNQVPLQTILEVWEALAGAGISIRDVPVQVQVRIPGP